MVLRGSWLAALLSAVLLLACGEQASATSLRGLTPQCRLSLATLPVVLQLRGGGDVDGEDLDEEDEEEDAAVDVAGAAGNPFLDGAGAAGLPGMPEGGPGLQDLQSTLNDPAALQEALKQLQDPSVQQQVKQMLEDPTFQESMKQYMEQITKDPQFEALKAQTEAMLQEEGFVEKMQEAFAGMAGPGGLPPGLTGKSDGEDES